MDPTPQRGALGPFELGEELGRGGMGVVYAATHRASDWPVAIKVLADAGDPALLEEARAIGALDHPNIVALFDAGWVSEAVGPIPAGVPWLAMERGLRTLADPVAPRGWSAARSVALALLDALAHAHARGVLHRDIKPSNVLLGCRRMSAIEPGPLGGLRLADFGIASRGESTGSGATVGFAAPEQLEGGEEGPWTDLYAVGALVRWMLTGSPTGAPSPRSPAAIGEWLAWLSAPTGRPDRAVLAAAGLLELPEHLSDEPEPRAMDVPWQTTTFLVHRPVSPREVVGSVGPAVPIPDSGAVLRTSEPVPTLAGVGLGRVPLGEPRWVGSTAGRDALWRALRAAESGPRVVALDGPSGVGVTRHARWIGHRAHAVGAGEPVLLDSSAPVDAGERVRARAGARIVVGHAPEGLSEMVIRVWLEAVGSPVLLVVERPTERLEGVVGDLGEVERVAIEPLDASDLRELLAGLLPAAPDRIEAAVAAARGCPGPAIAAVAGRSVEVERNRLLGILALAEGAVDAQDWEAVCGEPVGEAWADGIARGWLRGRPIRLRTELRAALAEGLTDAERREAHRRWAERRDGIERVRHAVAGGAAEAGPAAEALCRKLAADRDPRLARVAQWADSALGEPVRSEVRAMALPLEAPGHALEAYEARAVTLMEHASPTVRVRAAGRRSLYARMRRGPADAVEGLEAALDGVQASDADEGAAELEARSFLAHHRRALGRYVDAEHAADRAWSLYRAWSLPPRWGGLAAFQLANALRQQDRYADMLALVREVQGDLGEAASNLTAMAASIGGWFPDPDPVDAMLDLCRRQRRAGRLVAEAQLLTNASGTLVPRLRWAESEAFARRSMRLREILDAPRAPGLLMLAQVRLLQGDPAELPALLASIPDEPMHPNHRMELDALRVVALRDAEAWTRFATGLERGLEGTPALAVWAHAAGRVMGESPDRGWTRLNADPDVQRELSRAVDQTVSTLTRLGGTHTR